MMGMANTLLADRFVDGIYEEGLSEVLRALLYIPRQLSHTWLYDERGCRLFEKICELPEYYPTRTETAIMRSHAPDIAECLPAGLAVIELGSGASRKTRLLLDALRAPRAYVPIDIAASSLGRAARAVQRDYPDLSVLPLCADFSRRIELPEALPSEAPRLVYFPGSTLGNYESVEARRLLLTMRGLAGAGGAALLGIDLVKDRALLEHAYNDSQGVTAEFNLNALRHVNRRLGLGFDVGRFRHRAQWVESAQRIEMHLLASAPQSVRMGAAVVRMQRGDYIRTECSHKFSLEGLGALAADAGWQARASWCDPQQWFAVVLLEPRAAAADSGGLTHSS